MVIRAGKRAVARKSVKLKKQRKKRRPWKKRIRLDLLHSRKWHKAQMRAGKKQKESAHSVGCIQNAIAYWRMIFGLTDPRQRAWRISKLARRTYANKRWFERHLRQYGTSARMAIGEDIALSTLGLWRRRHGLSGSRGRRPKMPALVRVRLRSRKWLKQLVLKGKSDKQIALLINVMLKRRGIFLYQCTADAVEKARKRQKLPTVAGVRALENMKRRRAFSQWLAARKNILANLPRKQREILTRWYLAKRMFRSGVVLARQLRCTSANAYALRLEGLRRIHRMCKIPRRFWQVTLYLRRA